MNTLLQTVKDLAKDLQSMKDAITPTFSDTTVSLDERWELFRASPPSLKNSLTGNWDPGLLSVGLGKINWINVFGCNPYETCDPAEILIVALEEVDPFEGSIPHQLQRSQIVLAAFKEAILRDNVGTFTCGNSRSYS